MQNLRHDDRNSKRFRFAQYAMDVTFQQANRRSGNIVEGTKHFSGTHRIYGHKGELSVISIDLCTGWTQRYPRSSAHFKIFWQNSDFHEGASKKCCKGLGYFR